MQTLLKQLIIVVLQTNKSIFYLITLYYNTLSIKILLFSLFVKLNILLLQKQTKKQYNFAFY